MSEQKLSVKITFENATRRFSFENKPTFRELQNKLQKLLQLDDAHWSTFTIKYEDDEKDVITIASEEEFVEAVNLSSNSLLRLQVVTRQEVRNSTTAASPPPFPCPLNWDQLQSEAIRLFSSCKQNDIETARQLLLQQLALNRTHYLPLYNLACAEARLGNLEQALAYLEQAFSYGFKDFSQIQSDSDLDPLRPIKAFQNLISNLWKGPNTNPCSGKCVDPRLFGLETRIQELFKTGSTRDLEEARQLLLQQCRISEQADSYYNLACVEARLKNEKQALQYLRKAIDLGWKKGAHVDQDSDLDSIRNTSEFKVLRERLDPKPSTIPKSYEDELKSLADMGWTDFAGNLRLLQQTNGDIQTVVSILLMGNQ
jgi:tetratricopeptide (TPR) repeat protein